MGRTKAQQPYRHFESTRFLCTQERTLEDPENNYTFLARSQQISLIAYLLKSVSFCPAVNVTITSQGIRFTGEIGKYIQVNLVLHRDVFDEFTLTTQADDDIEEGEPAIHFRIQLKELLDCLKSFCSGDHGLSNSALKTDGGESVLYLKYKSYGSPLELILNEKDIITDFQLKTEPHDTDLMDFKIDDSVIAKIIFTSEPMSELLQEFEANAPELLRITIVPRKEIQFSCDGIAGSMNANLPFSSSVVHKFEADEEFTASYKMSIIKNSFKAMSMCETMAVRFEKEGILSITFLVSSRSDSFVEFYFFPSTVGLDIDDDLRI